jgi:DNA-binding NarL/FixJ family response regulator
VIEAIAAQARGTTELAAEEPQQALASLRRALEIWQSLEAPFEVARTRALMARACRALGDRDSARLELEAARSGFERLGAKPALAALEAVERPAVAHGLTDRELEVLRLVAAGHTNRQIAEGLVISEHTVARHLQNIFAKLGVSSRTAAGAFAFERGLV